MPIISQSKYPLTKIESRVNIKVKSGYYLEISTPETINLLGSKEKEIIKKWKWWKETWTRNYLSSITLL